MTDEERNKALLELRLQVAMLKERTAILEREILVRQWALRASEPRNEVAEDTTERKPIRRPFL